MKGTRAIRRVSQIRQFTPDPVPDDVVAEILEVARWTGSSRNGQPWHLIVVRDREKLKKIAALRPNINWAASAPVAIAIVLDGKSPVSETYDEGRMTERILTGATLLGYVAGVAWFGENEHVAEAKRILGIPSERLARQIIAIGKPLSRKDPRAMARPGGRRPLAELVSYERFGSAKP